VETSCYTYDALDELIQAWSAIDACASNPSTAGSDSTVGGPQPYWETWQYDPSGDRTQQDLHAVPGGASQDTVTSYAYGVSGHPHALASTSTTGASTGTTSYAYDGNGNTTSRVLGSGSQTLSYNAQDQLQQVALSGGGSASYVYAPQQLGSGAPSAAPTVVSSSGYQEAGAAVSQTAGAGGSETLTQLASSGGTLVQEDQGTTTLYLPDEELTYNTVTATTTGMRFYTFDGQTIAERTSASNLIFLYSNLVDTSQTAVEENVGADPTVVRRFFDPFGNSLSGTTGGSWPDQHQFLNKPTDPTSGLDLIGARNYDASIGRFISVDPFLDPTNPLQTNGYSYAANNPVCNADPSGEIFNGPLPDGMSAQAWQQQPSPQMTQPDVTPAPAQPAGVRSTAPSGAASSGSPARPHNQPPGGHVPQVPNNSYECIHLGICTGAHDAPKLANTYGVCAAGVFGGGWGVSGSACIVWDGHNIGSTESVGGGGASPQAGVMLELQASNAKSIRRLNSGSEVCSPDIGVGFGDGLLVGGDWFGDGHVSGENIGLGLGAKFPIPGSFYGSCVHTWEQTW
jgi:RHS repeat-associated protein